MDGQVVKEIVSFGNKIVPTTWMVFGGKVLPMEFALIPATYVLCFQRFLVALSQALMTLLTKGRNHRAYSSFFLGISLGS